jgi:hypothetical protein
MPFPKPHFVGYFPKATQPRPDWIKAPMVEEIASVATCISPAPEGWVQLWKHNALGFYDTLDLVREVTATAPGPFELFAYELFPIKCLDKAIEPAEVPVDLGAVPADFEFLGYDIVTRTQTHFFECSPLSCNGAASSVRVNSHCLIDGEERAERTLLAMSAPASGVEPGPYYVFKVYRQRGDAGQAGTP